MVIAALANVVITGSAHAYRRPDGSGDHEHEFTNAEVVQHTRAFLETPLCPDDTRPLIGGLLEQIEGQVE
jgi:hypothetical protein